MSLQDSSHTSPIELLTVMHFADDTTIWYCRGSALMAAVTAAVAVQQQGSGGSTRWQRSGNGGSAEAG
jgi:hypothetical protein